MKAGTLVADPAWSFRDKLPGNGRGAVKKYTTMSIDAIARIPMPPLRDDAWLWLWRVHTHQDEAKFVMRAWGFTYCSEVVWVKVSKSGSVRAGMGHYNRHAHEVCYLGRRGKPKRLSAAVPSVFTAALGKHSAKPDEFYAMVERFGAGPYVELFATRERTGWDCYGYDLGRCHFCDTIHLNPGAQFECPACLRIKRGKAA